MPEEPVYRSRHWAVKKTRTQLNNNRLKLHSIDTGLKHIQNHKISTFGTQK